MALNKYMLKKISEKTQGDERIKAYIIDILEFESHGKGWYKNAYEEILRRHCKGEK